MFCSNSEIFLLAYFVEEGMNLSGNCDLLEFYIFLFCSVWHVAADSLVYYQLFSYYYYINVILLYRALFGKQRESVS